MGNEEEEDVGNKNQPPLADNVNLGNLGVDNNNVNMPNQPENKNARLKAELTNDINRISPPKFYGTTLANGPENYLNKMDYFAIRNFLE
ncbi:hypothetical protein KI387_016042, partial [Taxus chinensis]